MSPEPCTLHATVKIALAALRPLGAEHAEVLRASGVDDPTIDFLVQLDADLAAGVSAEATAQLRHLIGRPTTPLLDGLRAAAARLR